MRSSKRLRIPYYTIKQAASPRFPICNISKKNKKIKKSKNGPEILPEEKYHKKDTPARSENEDRLSM
jgi:hypothetical protein